MRLQEELALRKDEKLERLHAVDGFDHTKESKPWHIQAAMEEHRRFASANEKSMASAVHAQFVERRTG